MRASEVGSGGVVAGAGETEIGNGAQGGVEHVLRVRFAVAVAVAVLAVGPPGGGEELGGSDGSIPCRVAVEDTSVRVGGLLRYRGWNRRGSLRTGEG